VLHFASPYFLLLLFFIPLLLENKGRKQNADSWLTSKQSHLKFSTNVDLQAIKPSFRSVIRQPLLTAIRIAIFSLFVIALARPQTGAYFTDLDASGRDIMLTLDVSNSMRALDFFHDNSRIDRITVLKKVVQDFIEKREGDRIGLVVFGETAWIQCPLTLDKRTLKEYLKLIQAGMAGGGTAIGDGIGIALKHLKEIKGESKVMVLVSDGESNVGMLHPLRAAGIAKELGIKIYTIGIGTSEKVPFPVENIWRRTVLTYQILPLDEKTLAEIAETTGGKYFYAKDTEALMNIYDEINKLETREDKIVQYVEYKDYFMLPLWLGVILVFIYELLSATMFRVIP
jgi:Ca-activated chloride channel family protein